MSTELVRIDPKNPEPRVIDRAASVLRKGGLVAFPTETVYGLGALADQASSLEKIYRAKRRPAHNPLIAHVPGENEARTLTTQWPALASELARAFWPGPLTLVLPRAPTVPALLSAGLETVAIRAPDHPVALALLRAVGRPLAAPSANPANGLSPTRAEHVMKGLAGRVDMVLDAGPCALGIESTVVDLTQDPPRVLRHGSLSLARLRELVPTLVDAVGKPETTKASPGMDRKHYAPVARLVVVPRTGFARAAASAEDPVGLVTRGGLTEGRIEGVAELVTLPDDPTGFGAAIYDALHRLDDAGCATILVESVPEGEPWDAVRDRLARASAE